MTTPHSNPSPDFPAAKKLKFHHFGLAVPRPDEARLFLSTLGYQLGKFVFDPAQGVHLQMCEHSAHPPVEIIWPGPNKGPSDKLIESHPQGIIYHVCYETSDLPGALADFQKAGLRVVCISPPTPALLFDGLKVSFYRITGIGLIEILENS